MPRMRTSATRLNPKDYTEIPALAVPTPNPLTPELPAHLTASSVMITSLPSIATNVDGVTRQFYLNRVPTRRLSLS